MHPSAQRTAGIVAVAAAVALVLWAVARLLGVDLDVRIDGDVRQVGDAVALMAMHLFVGATLIYGFATSQPSWPQLTRRSRSRAS